MYWGQLRIAEALALLPRDIDQEHRTATVHRGKGGRRRVVAIGQAAADLIAAWLVDRERLPLRRPDQAPLICDRDGSPPLRQHYNRLLRDLGRAAGLPQRIHPHGLRHSGAYAMLRAGLPIEAISGQLGHRSIATTSIYLAHLAPLERIRTTGIALDRM